MISTPFAHLAGRTYLIVNWSLPPASDLPTLPEMLMQLLRHYRPEDILILRPLSRAEHRLLDVTRRHSEHEVWAQIMARHGDRYRPRPGRSQK
jgi:hypothetical protein